MPTLQGPHVRKLIAREIFIIAIPSGCERPLQEGVRFLTDRDRVRAATEQATARDRDAIAAVKAAPGNPYGDDDEAIAAEILRQTEARSGGRRP